jgi:hypothetical protein
VKIDSAFLIIDFILTAHLEHNLYYLKLGKINPSIIGPCSAFANWKIKSWWLVVAYKGATNTVAPWPVPVRWSLRNLQMRKPFTAAFASKE